MTNHNFRELLRHTSLPGWLRIDLQNEVDCGMPKDSKLLLASAVEGLLLELLPEFHRITYTDPLTTARLLAKEPLIGKRLWTPTEVSYSVARLEKVTDLTTLLNYWCRARVKYRQMEREEAAAKIRFADGRPADLKALKAA